jgi:energy-coupling factor transport system permease protein
MIPVTVMISLLYPLTSPATEGPILWTFWIITITLPNILTGITMAIRIDTMSLVSYGLLFTTTQRDLVRSLVKFGLPYKYGLLVASAFRYLPAFDDIVKKITEAQTARGLDLTKGGFMQRMRSYIPLLAATMVTSLKLADQLAIALVSRAFGVSNKRTYLTDLTMRPIDVLVLVLSIIVFGIFLASKYFFQVIT